MSPGVCIDNVTQTEWSIEKPAWGHLIMGTE